MIGNKSDLEERQVDEKAARDLADSLGIKYFETSAKTGENVTEAVEALLEQVRMHIYFFFYFLLFAMNKGGNYWVNSSLSSKENNRFYVYMK